MLKKYWLGLPLINTALALLYHLDIFLYQITEQPHGREAPISYFSLLFIALISGGYGLLGAVLGFKLGRRQLTSVWQIILYSGTTFVTTFLILYIQNVGLKFDTTHSQLLISGEQTIGFFVGSFSGYLWGKYKSRLGNQIDNPVNKG